MSKVRAVQLSAFPDLVADRPTGPILASVFTGTNADLLAAVAPFYLTGSVLDVTYGEGKWWSRFRPDPFTAHDLYKLDGVDFTALPEADDAFDTVCFDPPYVTHGRVESSGVEGFAAAYGLGTKWKSPAELEALNLAGLTECCRVASGFVLVKCMEFVQGNGFHDSPHALTSRARELGWAKHDLIVHHTGHGPGGHNIFDPKRARRHHSYLIVFVKAAP